MWLFAIFYGSTFAIAQNNAGMDIVRYMAEIPLLHELNLNLKGLVRYYLNSGEVDILRTLLAYIVAYFTDNGFFLIIIYGAIYGYFFSRNMWYILEKLKGRLKPFIKIWIICLFLVIPLWNMNGFRFWTASHVFLFGLMPYLLEGKKKSLVWCLITPFLLHFSFLITLAPLAFYVIIGNKIKLYYFFFVLTLFISEINIQTFNKVLDTYAPEKLLNRTKLYSNEEKVEQLREEGSWEQNTVWYAKYYQRTLKYTLIFLILIVYWTFHKMHKFNNALFNLFSFILLFYGIANLLSSIPSGGRFIGIANLLTIAFLAIYFQNNRVDKNYRRLIRLSTPFILFFIIISLRISWFSFSLMTILGNPFTAGFTFGENIRIDDIIKGL